MKFQFMTSYLPEAMWKVQIYFLFLITTLQGKFYYTDLKKKKCGAWLHCFGQVQALV